MRAIFTMTSTNKQAKWIRMFRWLHRKLAVALFLFFLLVAITGLLLGIKKHTGHLAPTQKGTSADLSKWLSTDSLEKIARAYLIDSVSQDLSTELDRIDIRPGKGIAKFKYKDHYWGLQLDCATGKVLLLERRTGDFIEDLHDGSIIDDWLGTGDEQVKVGYTVIMGTSLLLLVLSGIWLWYGPKLIRKIKRQRHSS
jgi:uncharacterized iron-regulated membrane protein